MVDTGYGLAGYDGPLPDPDAIDSELAEVCGFLDSLLGTVRGILTQRLGMAQGLVSEVMTGIENAIKDQFLGSWEIIDDHRQIVQDHIASEIGTARSLASMTGLYTDLARPAGGVDVLGQIPAVVSQGISGAVPIDISYGTTTATSVMLAKWYCLKKPNNSPLCTLSTQQQLNILLGQGHTFVGGPFDSLQQCVSSCGQILSTAVDGTPTVPASIQNGLPYVEPTAVTPAIPVPVWPGGPATGPVPLPFPLPLKFTCIAKKPEGDPTAERVCVESDKAFEIAGPTDSEWYIAGGPYATFGECANVCRPRSPTTRTRFYCCKDLLSGDKTCLSTESTEPIPGFPGYLIVSGPYQNQQACQSSCAETLDQATLFWCVRLIRSNQYVCVQSVRELGPDNNPLPPSSNSWEVIAGPFDTAEQCALSCMQHTEPLAPSSPTQSATTTITDATSGWWCVWPEGGPVRCVNGDAGGLADQGYTLLCGPYPTQAFCDATCDLSPPCPTGGPPGETWFCYQEIASGAKQCIPGGQNPPAGWVIAGGPFGSQTECQASCQTEPGGPPAGWYCRPDGKCELTAHPPQGSRGPFGSETECIAACTEPPRPGGGICCEPPPPCPTAPPCPPCPPVYVFPPGGGITTEPPEVTDEEKEKRECEKKKCKEDVAWRAWLTCDGVCYVTAGHQGPRDTTDQLLCKTESLEEALSCCGTTKCPKPPEPDKCQRPLMNGFGSMPPKIDVPGQGGCPTGLLVTNPWDSLTACADLEGRISTGGRVMPCVISYFLGMLNADGTCKKFKKPAWVPSFVHNAIEGIVCMFGNLLCAPEALLETILASTGCNSPNAINNDKNYALLEWIQRIVGADMSRYQQPIKYEQQYICPTILPSASEATAAWLRNEIDDDLWACWTRANGHLPTPAARLREASRSRHTWDNMIRLWLRDKIPDSELNSRLRSIGWTRETDYAELRELAQQFPPYSDIIRLMVRDADDETIEDWPDSDKIWADKYGERLKRWGKSAGLPDEVAKLLWRAHWSIPAPTQLYSIWQRERHRGATIENDPLGQQITRALLQQDILPRWIPHLVGIAYRVLGRIDIRRGYQIGVLDRDQVDAAYIKLGHDDAGAEVMTEFTTRQAKLALRSHQAVRSYMSFGLNRAQATEELKDYGAQNADTTWVLDWALGRVRAKSREICVRSIGKQFKLGSLTPEETQARLEEQGLDADQIDIALSTFACEISSKGRTAQAAQLCKWLEYGLIDPAEFQERLIRLGWPADDATRIVASCTQALFIRQSREQQRRQREQEAAAKRAERERKALEKELKAEGDRAARLRAASESRREAREKMMLKASTKLAGKCGLPISSTAILVKDAVAQARTLGSSANEAVTAAVMAADALESGNCEDYLGMVAQFAVVEEEAGTVAGNGNGSSS